MATIEAAGRRWSLGELTDMQLKKCYVDLTRVAKRAPGDGAWDRAWWNAFCRVACEILTEHHSAVTVELVRDTFRPMDASVFIEELKRQLLCRHQREIGGSPPAD